MATSPGYWGDNRSNGAIWAGCAMTDFGDPTAPGVNWTLDNLWLSKVRQRDVGVGAHALLWMRHQLWFRASVWHPPINSYELSIWFKIQWFNAPHKKKKGGGGGRNGWKNDFSNICCLSKIFHQKPMEIKYFPLIRVLSLWAAPLHVKMHGHPPLLPREPLGTCSITSSEKGAHISVLSHLSWKYISFPGGIMLFAVSIPTSISPHFPALHSSLPSWTRVAALLNQPALPRCPVTALRSFADPFLTVWELLLLSFKTFFRN